MKFDKQIAIILILVSMLISAIGVATYFYFEQQKTMETNNKMVTVFVAKENIKKDTQITEDLIKETQIAKQFILTKPLLKNEIVNKYASESIFKNEFFLKEKLSIKIVKKEEKKSNLDFAHNSYNMNLKLFENANYSLKPNDIIKIISVYPTNIQKKDNKFSVQYVAKNIKVLGFLNDGVPTEKSIIKKRIKKLVNKKQTEEVVELKSEEIILDIKQKVLLSLIDDYNKGKQLWMVKSKFEEEKKKKKAPKKVYKPKYYPVKWYVPKTISSLKTATISYSNDNSVKQTKKAKFSSNFAEECSQKDKLIIVKSNKAYQRVHPSYRSKIHNTSYKNYTIPYISTSKINGNWYMLCDGSYINQKDVKEISYDEYLKLRK
ncbi:hypothetical protein ACMC56_02055 [Campylobacterota bacterium DY0563]